MNALRLTLRAATPLPIDLAPVTPDRLAGLSAADIGTLPLHHGNRRVPLEELFAVEGGDSDTLVIRNAGARLNGIGTAMSRGSIHVEGDAGDGLGLAMCGGSIHVEGGCGHWAAAELTGGTVVVAGDCGDFAAAARPGGRRGMAGGVLHVHGNAGDRLGDHMRRGLVLVRGGVGACCGARMIAGTIAALGPSGTGAGFGMRRGTLLLARAPAALSATFGDCGERDYGFLRLLYAWLRRLDPAFAALDTGVRARRFVGDLAVGGNGEVIVPGA